MKFENYKFIVFGMEHYNPLGIVRSLGQTGIDVDVIVIKSSNKILSKSKYISKLYVVDTIEEGYKTLFNEYSSEKNKPFVYTSDDKITSYLDKNYDEMKDRFVFFNAGASDRITKYMNKYNINTLAEKYGLNVLNHIVVDRGTIPSSLEYPVITKSISSNSGGWKDDVFICENENELKNAFEKIKSDRVLLQKYIQKKNELCLDGISFNNGRDIFISIASTYDYILPDKYSFYMSVENFYDSILNEKIKKIFEEIKFEGIFTIEFLIDKNDELYFLEINFRNSGWSYASTCVGMNLPIAWAYVMLNKELPLNFKKNIPNNFKAIVELSDFKERVMGKKISFISWIKELNKAKCKFYFTKDDPTPFFSAIIDKIFKK